MVQKTLNSAQRWFFIFLLGLLTFASQAQTNSVGSQNLSQIKVDDLSDEQILNFWKQLKIKGFSIEDIEKEAFKRKMPVSEFEKLKLRISSLAPDKEKPEESGIEEDEYDETVDKTKAGKFERKLIAEKEFDQLLPRVFGSELFNNRKLSFEPNLKMATPLNYQLGPGDELIIDVFGYSEESFKLFVSNDGSIKIPNIGIIHVNGLTIEQASVRIKQNLLKVYSRISSGETQVSISLGNIRSIKVTLIGEVNLQGTYTLPSLATVFNALYASGGPNRNGSLRNIRIIRNNKVIANLDVYEFIKNGIAKGNIRLQDQDIIKINPYEKRVELRGQVKREGLFEVTKSENLKQVIEFAGGFTDDAYRDRIKVTRNNPKQKSVADVPYELMELFEPKTGDIYQIDKILNRFENRVRIEGSVFRPGNYAIEEGLTAKKLIEKAEGLTEDAFLTRAILYRLREDNSLEMISFNLEELFKGVEKDILLKREDQIIIASKKELQNNYELTIIGEVLKPGKYKFASKMKIEDLIVAAGGFKESASFKRIEVSRRIDNADKSVSNSDIAIVGIYDVEKELRSNPAAASFELSPFDIVTVFTSPGYVKQKTINIEGEVMYPGSYTITKSNERISDVIKRCGGLTANSFVDGAMLIRAKSTGSVSQDINKVNKIRALKKQSKDTAEAKEEIDLELNKVNDIVGIDLKEILRNPGSDADLIVRENDVIRIPELRQTVLVSGQVLYPVNIRYRKSAGFKSYVNGAGGFSSKALKKRSYIVYANGTAKATKHFLFINFFPKVRPGAEIVIPVKEDKKPLSTIEVITITTSLTSMFVLIMTFMNTTK